MKKWSTMRSTVTAGLFSLMLVASACSSTSTDDVKDKVTSTASHVTSAVTSATEAPETVTTTATATETVTPQPEQDANPAGHACTDDNGNSGYLIPDNVGGWACTTGDSDEAAKERHANHDDNPGGHPCTTTDGATGYLIPNNNGGWFCQDPAKAPHA